MRAEAPRDRSRAAIECARARPTGLGCLAVLALGIGVAFGPCPLASAQGSAFGALDHAATRVELALRSERSAMRHSRRKAQPLLTDAIESLNDAGEAAEFAFEVGEISYSDVQTLYDLLETAIAEDRAASSPGVSLSERAADIKHAIAIKQEILKAIDDDERSPYVNPFTGALTPPPTPPQIKLGSALLGTPGALLGNFGADTEFWDAFYAALNGIGGVEPQDTAPVNGWLAGVWVKGYAVSGDMPGAGNSEPFRVGIEQPLPSGQLQVVSTSNPPFQLPGTSGTYYYWVGPPYTQFAMPVKKGEYLSFDTRGGTWAIFSAQAGSTVDSATGTGLQQNPGVVWTPTSHAGIELDVQWLEQPSLSVTKLKEAGKRVHDALAEEEAARRASKSRAKGKLLAALAAMKAAEKLIEEAGSEGAVSEQTGLALSHLAAIVEGDDAQATRHKQHGKKTLGRRLSAAIADKRKLLRDIEEAKGLAEKVP